MLRAYIYIIMLASAVGLLSACAVHQWPEQREEPLGRVAISLHYETDFWLWEHNYDPKQGTVEALFPDSGVDADHPETSDVYSNEMSAGAIDIYAKVYREGNTDICVAEYKFNRDAADGYDCELDIRMPAGCYEVLVWSHLRENADTEPFYDPSNFRTISIIDQNYRGNTDYRDAFCGRTTFEVPVEPQVDEEYECQVEMRRPMGKIEFVTTDLSEFLDRETERRSLPTRASIDDYRVILSYPNYYLNAYNFISDNLASATGYQFETKMSITGVSEASMGFDYVFIKSYQGAVQARVSVYDTNGECVANSQTITLPVQRDYHTLLRGAFLSMQQSGGVGVNPDYDGDHNVGI